MLDVETLPAVNASLNGVATILLTAGYVFIRRGQVSRHRACMLAAFAVSVLFLASYTVYHANVGSRPFAGEGIVRFIYFAVLIPHVVLAAVVPPLALLTLARALRGQLDRHRRLARWTLPIWLFVSVTGVVVYLFLYVLF